MYGIELVEGKYIAFIDSDDYLKDEYIKYMLQGIQGMELVICGYDMIYKDKIHIIIYDKENVKIEKNQVIYLYEKKLLNTLWNKLYLTEIIKENNIRFYNNIYKSEDLLFNLDYISNIKGKIAVLNKSLYSYEMKNSGLNLKKDESLESKINRINLLYNKFIKISQDEKERVVFNIIEMYKGHIKNYIRINTICNPFRIKKIIKDALNNETFKNMMNDDYKKNSQIEMLKSKFEKKKVIQMFYRNTIILNKLKK